MIILSAFEKFGKYKYNLSESIVNKFPNYFNKHLINKLIIPVSWRRSLASLNEMQGKNQPNPPIILLTGIHEKKSISIEERAYNFKFGFDEDGSFKCGFIKHTGNCVLKTDINIGRMLFKLKDYKEVEISAYPGFFLCNYIYYISLFFYKSSSRVLLIHFPSSGSLKRYTSVLTSILTIMLKNE
jgi:pyrrolidone-carboxylate peptidase